MHRATFLPPPRYNVPEAQLHPSSPINNNNNNSNTANTPGQVNRGLWGTGREEVKGGEHAEKR
ncbi:unnamed protein product [Ectocarpus sp. 6 AP-2014]